MLELPLLFVSFSKADQVKIFKVTPLKTKTADGKFSMWIRQRDGMCRRCKRTGIGLDNSHYWRRDMKRTRFDPKNCIALCRDCHTAWERHQNNEYKAFMVEWLGRDEYDALEERARTSMQMRDAVLELMTWLK
ncbi:HNH endonuclease [Bradyrhizobium sp. AUGA SZCCT0431]|uniref:HNH endonuclease signature motif containing protein n=1 Tax=Bradyrhizobium sp. AUGA SZCCT0431 TaxID=2807674 RepID=UPI001BABFC4B|nr:HNH endonuclease [Bradyrhizobium sp. AUGA SZCCT0431]MBR1146688.1 HNH endonuclease [Bradyrhizobium sp. AUGA SZCCT0431]